MLALDELPVWRANILGSAQMNYLTKYSLRAIQPLSTLEFLKLQKMVRS